MTQKIEISRSTPVLLCFGEEKSARCTLAEAIPFVESFEGAARIQTLDGRHIAAFVEIDALKARLQKTDPHNSYSAW